MNEITITSNHIKLEEQDCELQCTNQETIEKYDECITGIDKEQDMKSVLVEETFQNRQIEFVDVEDLPIEKNYFV